ncbi:5'-nucleotidase C-terminal domain-containing protein [Paenalkalicoccus suaedae]|uniref:5'-nucleotidase C-terminal domain-containing protein n=1 Tax=Paenalkalicoccus suaedae TaxID=2592382 RepID=A0A859FIZ9_9BACI|nr:5'-nucleotidase C-terminal domain-containing protein [Paenalkalicoccus suaedae]QKS72346.1 5'-nucleotidase C-terminal domain-containing protein [Paenalkalicoccus suaedae]
MSTWFSKRKTAIAATAAFVLSAPMAAQADTHSFSDIQESNFFYEAVNVLSADGIINGYEDGTFRPQQGIERQHAAALIARALGLNSPDSYAIDMFDDVDSSSPYASQIAALYERGIILGFDGSFNPTDQITREQMASILVRAYNLAEYLDQPAMETINLDDVHPAHEADVQLLANYDLTTELSDYMAKSDVTRGEFATFLHRTLLLDLPELFDLEVLHTNDLHSRVEQYPRMITAVDRARQAYPDALLVEAGDIFSGTLYFNIFQGLDSVEFMNMMDYDAFVPGNHEFDLGNAETGGHEELAAFFAAANFPVVASNVDFSLDPFVGDMQVGGISDDAEAGSIYDGIIKEVNGEQVGIFGLTTESTATIASPVDVLFSDYIAEAERMVDEFEAAGIDKIIALTHLGYDSNPNLGNDILLAENVEGIDIIVGGHSHDTVLPDVYTENADGEPMEPTVIVQANEYGNLVGELRVGFDANGVIERVGGQHYEVDSFPANAEAAAMLAPLTEEVEAFGGEEIGVEAAVDFPNPRSSGDSLDSVRSNETGLGNVITDGMLVEAKRANAETVIAFQNAGGIRAPLAAGQLTIGDLITVQPFGNRLSIMDLTGAEIKEALEHSVNNAPNESGGFLHVAGMRFTFDSDREVGDRVVSMEVMIDGEYVDLDLNENYFVATNDFTANGGDGFTVFAEAEADGRVQLVGSTDWETLRRHLLTLESPISPVIEGRITDLGRE